MPSVLQAIGEPLRAGADLHAANEPGGVARAELGGFDRDAGERFDLRALRGDLGRRHADRQVVEDADFARDADVPEAIGAIAGDFEVDRFVAGTFEVEARQRKAIGQFRRRPSPGRRSLLANQAKRSWTILALSQSREGAKEAQRMSGASSLRISLRLCAFARNLRS